MGLKIAVVGEPTKGKSTSILPNQDLNIQGLDPKETIIISFSGKQLPVKGANKLYPRDIKLSEGGNFLHCTDVKTLPDIINFINEKRKEIKNIVLEDAQYSMSFEYMNRAKEKTYDKFVDIGVNFAKWMKMIQDSREDLYLWVIWHPEIGSLGSLKMKTVGNLVDNYLTMEGLMDHILYANCEKGADGNMEYYLVTNNDGVFPSRTAPGMFTELHVKNDLGFIRSKIENYYN